MFASGSIPAFRSSWIGKHIRVEPLAESVFEAGKTPAPSKAGAPTAPRASATRPVRPQRLMRSVR
jgi:hypothetical protein